MKAKAPFLGGGRLRSLSTCLPKGRHPDREESSELGVKNTEIEDEAVSGLSAACNSVTYAYVSVSGPSWERTLVQGLANLFYKGPDSKYFQLWGPYGLCHSFSALPL